MTATLATTLAGCAVGTSDFDHAQLDRSLHEVSGHHLPDEDHTPGAPPGTDLLDGMDMDEAVAIALWNNPDFAATLADMGVRRAQLAESGLLRNPLFQALFPVGPKQLEFMLDLPIDSLFQRGSRIAAARFDCEQMAAVLLRTGLDLVRDVRLAFVERNLAERREALAQDALVLERRLVDVAQARLDVGDASELEVDTSRIAALEATREYSERRAALLAAEDRLWSLLGWRPDGDVPRFEPAPLPTAESAGDRASLVTLAVAARPDLRAAEVAVEAAGARAGLARDECLRLSAIYDANGKGTQGFESGPGILAELPIFNQGLRVASTTAEVQAALRRLAGVRHRILTEVEAARLTHEQAIARMRLLDEQLRPARTGNLELVQRLVAAGSEPPSATLLAEQALLRLDIDLAEANAALQRAFVDLERATGCRIPAESP